jgi:DNA-3-methyladenine glycosylase II
MQLAITTRPPFSFDQTLAFVRRFPPALDQTIVSDDSVTIALAVGGRARAVEIARQGRDVVAIVDGESPPETQRELVRRAADFIGAGDDVSALYTAAETDPPFRALVRELHGLHQVRFLGLEEIAVYCVMMQRAPIARAVELERRFLARFGLPIAVGARTLRAFPPLAELAQLDARDIADAIGNRPKGERIATVVRAVAALGEPFLATAPYAAARDALLAIPGVGPFAAGAILLRGLGRVDEVPSLAMFARDGRAIYGARWDETTIARRYGSQIGYWAFYLKTGAARVARATATAS